MKKIVIGVFVLLAIVVGGFVYFYSNLGGLLKELIETAGTEVTEVDVTLDEVDVERITEGHAALRGLTVGNPANFKTDSAFQLGEISVTLDPNTVLDDIVIIKKVVIAKPVVTYEFGGSGSNVGTIRKTVEKKSGAGGKKSRPKPKAAKKSEPAKSGSGKGRKLVIENLYIRGGRVNVSAAFLKDRKVSATLPDIHLRNIGKPRGKVTGATPAEVAQRVVSALTGSATKAVGKLNVAGIKDALGKELGAATKSLREGAGSAAGKLKGGAGGVTKELKGLFGK